MPKPQDIGGYTSQHTADCERIPAVPPHAGTLDVDVVIDLQILADTDAYESLEANLKRLYFERAENEQGKKVAWRWKTQTEHGATMILEFLAEDPRVGGGRVQALPTEGNISALNIPHSSMVFDLYEETEIRAELLDERGIATVTVKHADIGSFTCLKAFAYEDRQEPKDAHDLMYCLEHRSEGLQAIAATFRTQLAGKHGGTIRSGLELLRSRFVDAHPTFCASLLGIAAELDQPRLLGM